MSLSEILENLQVRNGSLCFRPLYWKGSGTSLIVGPKLNIFYAPEGEFCKVWIPNLIDLINEKWEICSLIEVMNETNVE